MLSFPSTLNEARYQYSGDKFNDHSFNIERLKSMNINTSVATIQEQLKPKQIVLSNYRFEIRLRIWCKPYIAAPHI